MDRWAIRSDEWPRYAEVEPAENGLGDWEPSQHEVRRLLAGDDPAFAFAGLRGGGRETYEQEAARLGRLMRERAEKAGPAIRGMLERTAEHYEQKARDA